jgi:hypothetical protein
VRVFGRAVHPRRSSAPDALRPRRPAARRSGVVARAQAAYSAAIEQAAHATGQAMNKTFAPIASFVLATAVTLAMLAGVNGLATADAPAPQLAQTKTSPAS